VLEAHVCRRFSVLDKPGADQCALNRFGIVSEQIEIAKRTIGWNRIVGGDLWTLHEHQSAPICGTGLAKDEPREHRLECGRAHIGPKIGRNLASMRPPDPGGCEVQMMLPEGLETRRSLDESFDHIRKQAVIAGARLSTRLWCARR
jgi:hypothetical protein